MKKVIIALAVLVMAFGNVGFAQRNTHLKSKATAIVLKYYGVRDETTVVPQLAQWMTEDGETYRTTYTYDEYDYYLIEEVTEFAGGSSWENYYKLQYEYDFYGNVIEALAQSSMGNGWVNEARASYTYEGDQPSEVVYQNWEGGAWVNDTKEVYNYNGDVTTVLYWDWNGNNWTSDELYTYTYSGETIELLIQYMQGGAWQNDEKQLFTLNFDERVVEIIEQEWVGTSWVNDERISYRYVGGVYPDKTVEEWNGSAWEIDCMYDFVYDQGNAKVGECKKPSGNDWEPCDGDIEMAFGYSEKSNTYYGWRVEVSYVDLTSVNEDAQQVSFLVYPVPAQGEIFIEAEGFQKAEIYSLTGQKLMESLRDRMNVSALSSGLYVIKVYDREGGCATQRFVVK